VLIVIDFKIAKNFVLKPKNTRKAYEVNNLQIWRNHFCARLKTSASFIWTFQTVIDLNNNVELSFSFESCDSIALFTPLASEQNFQVYPNPTNSIIHLSSSDIPYDHYKIYTINGRTILIDKSYSADVSFLDQGLYFVSSTTKAGKN